MIRTSTSTDSTATAILTVRAPLDSTDDVATALRRRLGRIEGVDDVTLGELRDIEPRLSATAVTVVVTFDTPVAPDELRERLADHTSVEAIDDLERETS